MLDADGVLHRGDRWVALPPIESRLAELLLRRLGQVAHRPELVGAAWPGEVALGERALDGAVKRLRRHIAPLDLHIHRVSGRGFLLDLGG